MHWLVAVGQQAFWPDWWLQAHVALVVPLQLHSEGVQGLQGVAPAGCTASTDGAACLPVDSAADIRLPGMVVAALSSRAQPPDFARGAAGDVCWSEVLILGGVPLGGQVWVLLGQGWLPCSSQPLQECTDNDFSADLPSS